MTGHDQPDDPAAAANRRYQAALNALRDSERRVREAHQQYGWLYYRTKRFQTMTTILERVRVGLLPADWRDRLQPADYTDLIAHNPGYQFYSDADILVVAELQARPIADWEPHRGIGWRAALTAWRAAGHTVLDDYLAAHDATVATMRASGAAQATIEALRNAHRSLTSRARDMHEASYRAGLAAGGDPIDWRAWLRERISTWPDIPVRATELDALNDPNYRSDLDTLPAYWTSGSSL